MTCIAATKNKLKNGPARSTTPGKIYGPVTGGNTGQVRSIITGGIRYYYRRTPSATYSKVHFPYYSTIM